MSTAAQILANQANAQLSTGPVTAEGKARVARNAAGFGLFSATAFLRPGEEETYREFTASYAAELSPATPLEDTLATEIIHAAWRLRRCANLESNPPAHRDCAVNDESPRPPLDLECLQISIDRARSSAQRSLHRSLAELRRLQTERVYRELALPPDLDRAALGQANVRHLDPPTMLVKQVQAEDARLRQIKLASAKQTQSASAKQTQSDAPIARGAACPCGSGSKYKRCCGRNAPPVLMAA